MPYVALLDKAEPCTEVLVKIAEVLGKTKISNALTVKHKAEAASVAASSVKDAEIKNLRRSHKRADLFPVI
jgi:hypothetical protein